MGQKINPLGFRLGITEYYRSHWFSASNVKGERYRDFVGEDDKIRRTLRSAQAPRAYSQNDHTRAQKGYSHRAETYSA